MTTLLDMYNIAEQNDISVDCIDLVRYESLSLIDRDGDCYVAIDPIILRSEREEKVKLAHELGHCMEGAFYNQYSPYDT